MLGIRLPLRADSQLAEQARNRRALPCGSWLAVALTAPLLIPSLFSVRAPRQRAPGRREGLQALSSTKCSGFFLRSSSPIRPTRARHLYSMDSKAAFSFAFRPSNLSGMGAAL